MLRILILTKFLGPDKNLFGTLLVDDQPYLIEGLLTDQLLSTWSLKALLSDDRAGATILKFQIGYDFYDSPPTMNSLRDFIHGMVADRDEQLEMHRYEVVLYLLIRFLIYNTYILYT